MGGHVKMQKIMQKRIFVVCGNGNHYADRYGDKRRCECVRK